MPHIFVLLEAKNSVQVEMFLAKLYLALLNYEISSMSFPNIGCLPN